MKVGARGAVTNLRTGEPAIPRIPGTAYLDDVADPMAGFADWLTAKDNPYFAQAQVNRLWRAMFGRGLVEPVDDLRATNPREPPGAARPTRRRLRPPRLRHPPHAAADRAQPGVRSQRDAGSRQRGRRPLLRPRVPPAPRTGSAGRCHRRGDGRASDATRGMPAGTRAITIYDPLEPGPVARRARPLFARRDLRGERRGRRTAGEAPPAQRRVAQRQDRRQGRPPGEADRRGEDGPRDRRPSSTCSASAARRPRRNWRTGSRASRRPATTAAARASKTSSGAC